MSRLHPSVCLHFQSHQLTEAAPTSTDPFPRFPLVGLGNLALGLIEAKRRLTASHTSVPLRRRRRGSSL